MNRLQKLAKVADALKQTASDPSTVIPYNALGVGGQENCTLQVIANSVCRRPADVKALAREAVYNTLMLNLSKAGSVSAAILLCKEARNVGWAVSVGFDPCVPGTGDTFLSDFAVGVGSGQLYTGGLLAGEGVALCNRLLQLSREDTDLTFVGRYFRR